MQSSDKESDSARILRRSSRVRNDLEAIRPRRTRGKRCRYVVESLSDDSSIESSEDNPEDDITNIEPASETTDSSERTSLNSARQISSSESSILAVGSCDPSETIKAGQPEQPQPEQPMIPYSNVKNEPQAEANPIAKLSQQIKSYKKRRRNELDILFTTRGSSDLESSVPSAYQIRAEIHDRAKRIKRGEDSRSSPMIEGVKSSNRVDKQKSLECQPGKEPEPLVAVSRKHGPSRWRQRIDNPLFFTPDPEGNLEGSDQRESPLSSAEYLRRKAQCLPRKLSEQNSTPAASVITRAQYKDFIARSSLEPMDSDRGLLDSSRSRTSSLGSRHRQSSKNRTRPRRVFSDRDLNGCTTLDYPRSWDKATVADRRLVEMRDREVFWNVVRDTWQDITERQIAPETLKLRHSYLVSLRDGQSNITGPGVHIDDETDVRSENAGKSQKSPSKAPRVSRNERIDSSEGDDSFVDEDLGQSSGCEESSDSNDQYRENSEPDGPARAIRGQSSHNIKQRILSSTSKTVKHVPPSQRNNSLLSVSNQETSTSSTCGPSSWKLASRQAKSQNPMEKYYKHLKTIFKGRDFATELEEPGTAVKALELAALVFKSVPVNVDAPEPSEERPVPRNGTQTICEEPLDKQNATLLLAVEAEVDSRLATQKHIAIAETMKSKVTGLFRPAFIEQELNRLHNTEKKDHSCCAITRSEIHQNLTTAHRHEIANLDATHSNKIQTLETAHRAQIAQLVTSHRAQITDIRDKIRHEAQKIARESTRTSLGFITKDTPSSNETSNPNRRTSCDGCGLAHTKCTRKASEMKCSRCVNLGIECVYGLCGSRMRTSGTRMRDSSELSE